MRRVKKVEPRVFAVEYEAPFATGIVLRSSDISKSSWAEIIKRCGIVDYKPSEVKTIMIDNSDKPNTLSISIIVKK